MASSVNTLGSVLLWGAESPHLRTKSLRKQPYLHWALTQKISVDSFSSISANKEKNYFLAKRQIDDHHEGHYKRKYANELICRWIRFKRIAHGQKKQTVILYSQLCSHTLKKTRSILPPRTISLYWTMNVPRRSLRISSVSTSSYTFGASRSASSGSSPKAG